MHHATRATLTLMLGSLAIASAAAVSSSSDAPPRAPSVRPAVALAHEAPAPVPAAASRTQAPARTSSSAPVFDGQLLTKYCVRCHNERGKARAGGLALDQIDPAKIAEHAPLWEKVVGKLP